MSPDTAIGADELAAIEEQLGAGWERNVHYRPPAGTGVEEYHGEIVLNGDDAPFSMAPHHVEWWRHDGDALRVSCREPRYAVGGEADGVVTRNGDLDSAVRYLEEELGYEQVDDGTEREVERR